MSEVPGELRWAYERGQLERAMVRAVPAGVMVLLGVALSAAPGWSMLWGGSLFFAALVLGWIGLSVGRGVFPGLVVGILPFSAPLAARALGHVCTATGCYSLCAPACAGAGIVAGGVLGFWLLAGNRRTRWVTFGVASLFVMASGLLGCGCFGAGNLFGVVGGYLTGGSFPLLWQVLRRD